MKGLVIGKFELPHKGHEALLRQIEEQSYVELVYLVLTSNGHNFFPYELRKEMLQQITGKFRKPWHYFDVPDINDPANYADHIRKTVCYEPEDTVLFSNNPETTLCFEDKIARIEHPHSYHPYSSSKLLEMLVTEGPWEEAVSDGIKQFVIEHDLKQVASNRYSAMSSRHGTPRMATDIIIQYQGGIVLIERKFKPYGWALPGGMFEKGLTGPENAVKEAKEETHLDVDIVGLMEARTDPARDPRDHIVSLAYVAKGQGNLKADDDAKNSMVIKSYGQLPVDMAFPDHRKMVWNYFNKYLKGERIEPD